MHHAYVHTCIEHKQQCLFSCNVHIDFRIGFVTNDSINKRSEFLRVLNSSYKIGCLHLGMNDTQLSDFFQEKKRNTESVPKKRAVNSVGRQADGTWVLSEEVHLDDNGEIIPGEMSSFVWIGHLYQSVGIADCNERCTIQLPLTTRPLTKIVQLLECLLRHNFLPCLMTFGASVLVFHYKALIDRLRYCPVPLIYSLASGTGKTTALRCSMALFGADKCNFFSKVTIQKVLQLCSKGTLPIAIDDPDSVKDVNRLIIDLYNGAQGGTKGSGVQTPTARAVISANFTATDRER